MPAQQAAEMKICHTPTPGKKPTAIPVWKYNAIRQVILSVVPKEAPGIPAMNLPSLVEPKLSQDHLSRLGSVGWHVTTVKLNMEVEGELERVPGEKPQHLIRSHSPLTTSERTPHETQD